MKILAHVLLLIMTLPTLYGLELLDLSDKHLYTFDGEKYRRPCNNNICEMELEITKFSNITDYVLQLESMTYSTTWKYTAFDSNVFNLQAYYESVQTLANGSATSQWLSLDSVDAHMDKLYFGQVLHVKYVFSIEKMVDIVPVLYTNNVENRFEELAIFFPQDPSTQWPVYFPFDTSSGISDPANPIPNFAFQAAGTWKTDNAFVNNWTNSSATGLLINGSYGHIRTVNNSWIGEQATWVPSADTFVNDSATFALLGKNFNCQASPPSNCGLLHFQDNQPVISITYLNNNSFFVELRDTGATETSVYFKPYPAHLDIWNLYSWVFSDYGTTVELKMYINTTLWGAQNITTGASLLFDGIGSCDIGDGACEFIGSQVFDGFALNGYFDEIRLYAIALDPSALAQMSAQYFTTVQHNISFTDGLIPPIVTTQYTNKTLQINFTNTTTATFSVNNSIATITSVNETFLTLLLNATTIGTNNITITGNVSTAGAQQWVLFTVQSPTPSTNQTNGTITNVNVNVDMTAVNLGIKSALSWIIIISTYVTKIPGFQIMGGLFTLVLHLKYYSVDHYYYDFVMIFISIVYIGFAGISAFSKR